MSATTQDDYVVRLARIVGATHTSAQPTDCNQYGKLEPRAVVWPGTADEVASVLDLAREASWRVALVGAATRGNGGWPESDGRPRVALVTRRLADILHLDETSLTVRCGAGILLEHLEAALRQHGLTLGPLPARALGSTLGGALARPHPDLDSPRHGSLGAACIAVSIITPAGRMFETRAIPRRATGPDLGRMYLNSQGLLGAIVDATLRVQRIPQKRQPLAFGFAEAASALSTGCRLLDTGVRPEALQILLNAPAVAELVQSRPPPAAALAVALAGPSELVRSERQILASMVSSAGGSALPQDVADRWADNGRLIAANAQLRDYLPIFHTHSLEVATALAQRLSATQVRIWLDQLTPQGGNIWLAAERSEGELCDISAQLSAMPVQAPSTSLSPIAQRVRAQLDPAGTLVSPDYTGIR